MSTRVGDRMVKNVVLKIRMKDNILIFKTTFFIIVVQEKNKSNKVNKSKEIDCILAQKLSRKRCWINYALGD